MRTSPARCAPPAALTPSITRTTTSTVHTFNALRESVRGVEWKVVGNEIARLREIKDEDELALIRQACRITGDAFERILPSSRRASPKRNSRSGWILT